MILINSERKLGIRYSVNTSIKDSSVLFVHWYSNETCGLSFMCIIVCREEDYISTLTLEAGDLLGYSPSSDDSVRNKRTSGFQFVFIPLTKECRKSIHAYFSRYVRVQYHNKKQNKGKRSYAGGWEHSIPCVSSVIYGRIITSNYVYTAHTVLF